MTEDGDLLNRFLNHTWDDTVLWDSLRFTVAVTTLICMIFYIRIAFGKNRPGDDGSLEARREIVTIRIGIIGYLFVLMSIILTEVQQLGQPVVMWRLPLYAAANIMSLWYCYRRL